MANYIKIDGILIEVLDIKENEIYTINKAYKYENAIYVFRGKFEIGEYRPGLYMDDNDELVYIEYDEGKEITEKNIIKRELNNIEELLNNAKKLKDKENVKKPKKESISNPNRSTSSTLGRPKNKSEEPIIYEIYDEDDDMVRLIKEAVMDKGITMQDVYNKFESNNEGYNLIYGLRVRNSLSFSTAQKWADILGMKIEITLVDIDNRPIK